MLAQLVTLVALCADTAYLVFLANHFTAEQLNAGFVLEPI